MAMDEAAAPAPAAGAEPAVVSVAPEDDPRGDPLVGVGDVDGGALARLRAYVGFLEDARELAYVQGFTTEEVAFVADLLRHMEQMLRQNRTQAAKKEVALMRSIVRKMNHHRRRLR